jgi:lipopolysaccharide/colanic/teichoic acid biosynthesis glycosyltransferase
MSSHQITETDEDVVITLDLDPVAEVQVEHVSVHADPAGEPSYGWYVRTGKRLLDVMVAGVALVVLIPLLLLLSLAVLLTVGRPIIFSQTRVGRGGMPFSVYKFRTMHPDRRRQQVDFPGEDRRRTHKSPDDPRLTRTGRIMRRLSLDELPQLVNVIRGDMSLVGPRPELPDVVLRHYQADHHKRHLVRPGITGLWQITERGNGMMHEHVHVDLTYVDQLGLRTDVHILLRTIPAALGARRGF